MNLTYSKCKEIFDTLPIGYYLGHNIPAELSETDPSTYFNTATYTITVSYPMIASALKKIDAPEDLEQIIRGLLYHEISHVIMTPGPKDFQCTEQWKRNTSVPQRLKHNLLNIMEDERIESLLRKYYLDTDFRKNVDLINAPETGYTLAMSDDPMDRFYAAVRFRVGPKVALDKVKEIINNYCFDRRATCRELGGYVKDIFALYKYFDQKVQREHEDQQAGKKPPMPKLDNQSDEQANSMESVMNKESDQPLTPEQLSRAVQIMHENIKKLVENNFIDPRVKAAKERVTRILTTAMNRRANQSPSLAGYAGRVDPRLCGDRKYKWFVKRNDGSAGNKFSKIKLNLFVDNSSSFGSSRRTINALSDAIADIEKQFKDFSFDFVRVGNGVKKMPKNDRFVLCDEGSALTNDIIPIYRSLQDPNALTANIAVFDGDLFCCSGANKERNLHAWRAFDQPNCQIVTDPENMPYIMTDCPRAKVHYIEEAYAQVFVEKVLSALERLLA